MSITDDISLALCPHKRANKVACFRVRSFRLLMSTFERCFMTFLASQVKLYFGEAGLDWNTSFRYLITKGCLPTGCLFIITKVDRADRATFIALYNRGEKPAIGQFLRGSLPLLTNGRDTKREKMTSVCFGLR